MIVAGWADGYRNNSFRTVAELAQARCPAPAAGRTVGARRPDDGDARAADRLRRRDGARGSTAGCAAGRRAHEDGCDVFVRTSTRPEPDLDLHEGYWVRLPIVPPRSKRTLDARPGPGRLVVRPGRRHRAWIDCAGHLPWGLSGDQRLDDARSLTWDFDAAERPRRRPPGGAAAACRPTSRWPRSRSSCATSSPTAPRRWSPAARLDLAYRDGVHGAAGAAGAGRGVRRRGRPRRLRLRVGRGPTARVSIAGSDWPNTVAPAGAGDPDRS